MGGRGASSGRGGGGVALNNPQSQTKTVTPEEKIAAALGAQGTPKTIEEAFSGANPNYAQSRQLGDRKYTANCQRCVWATELRRRGYDVEAMPRTSDDSYAKAYNTVANSFLNVADGGLTLNAVNYMWHKSTATEIKDYFTRKYSDGMRGMIVATIPGGHVFNWEIVNGKVVFYDGQPGFKTVPTKFLKKWSYFREARMDNVKVTPLVADFVRTKGSNNAY